MHRQNPSRGSDGKKSSSRQSQQPTQSGRLLPEQIPQRETFISLFYFNINSHKWRILEILLDIM